MKSKDGKSYAEVTLRDVVENYDVSDFPMLAEIKRLYAENSMLRELENIRMTQVEHCETLTEDIEMFKAEVDKLRELVRKYGEYIDQDHCEGCVCKSRCNDGYVDECWQLTEIRELASKLGIRVS